MSEGVLPMRHLGVALSSKNLTQDYGRFTRKICAKISSWQSRLLSMAEGDLGFRNLFAWNTVFLCKIFGFGKGLTMLHTRDRLLKWGMDVDPHCPLCSGIESEDHLFFSVVIRLKFGDCFCRCLGLIRVVLGGRRDNGALPSLRVGIGQLKGRCSRRESCKSLLRVLFIISGKRGILECLGSRRLIWMRYITRLLRVFRIGISHRGGL
ncbi:hypothetical protein LIER_26055 [Lithospermum erythrorhizon]|uniref:Reverse transcriptase zinc-binding domain-containing protein n=1 Tax=Lithospermum erythrorhizon TaxID=34254 RepID=A0AAV3R8J8_LITER